MILLWFSQGKISPSVGNPAKISPPFDSENKTAVKSYRRLNYSATEPAVVDFFFL